MSLTVEVRLAELTLERFDELADDFEYRTVYYAGDPGITICFDDLEYEGILDEDS